MIAAVGTNVQAIDKDGGIVMVTDKSFAAPAVGGAALLKQHWPRAGGRAIARILLDTATDMGAPGVDAVYGVGMLNVEKAMQAQAPAASFVAAQAAFACYASVEVSAPFGGAATASRIAASAGRMTVFDRYGRDFTMAGATCVRARSSGLLAGSMLGNSVASVPRRWSAAEERVGFCGQDVVGPWQGATADRPAVAGLYLGSGRTMTIEANSVIGGGTVSLSGSPLRGGVGQPVGMRTSWAVGGWSDWSHSNFILSLLRARSATNLSSASCMISYPSRHGARHGIHCRKSRLAHTWGRGCCWRNSYHLFGW